MTKPQTPDERQNSTERDGMPENCKCDCQCTQDVPKARCGGSGKLTLTQVPMRDLMTSRRDCSGCPDCRCPTCGSDDPRMCRFRAEPHDPHPHARHQPGNHLGCCPDTFHHMRADECE